MEAIVAVYENWGIGRDGTQPIALSADRRFFREKTRGTTVIMGRRTMEDLPGPLPGRVNVVLSRSLKEAPGFTVISDLEQAESMADAMVIGGGSVYRQMLPLCQTVYVTKLSVQVESDTFFPNLDQDPAWSLAQILQSGEENGIRYQICKYTRVDSTCRGAS